MGITHAPAPDDAPRAGGGARPQSVAPGKRGPSLRAILAYQNCDSLSGALICFMVVFSPWAFGTTQQWSVWTMNIAGYFLGLLLLGKWCIRGLGGHEPPRWNNGPGETSAPGRARWQISVAALAVLTVAILSYCLVAAINARSTYNAMQMEFVYRPHVAWLPHSYDRARTLEYFANYLALAGFFWAARDWLLGKTEAEIRAARSALSLGQGPQLPARLRMLLWVLSVNGALLGIEGIAQRLSGTNKLLWWQPTHVNTETESQFGPYAYRGSAAQYFNLVWPVALAFWWALRREARRQSDSWPPPNRAARPVLLLAVLVMAACPIITLSRGGALVALGNLVVAAILIVLAMRRKHALTRFGVVLFFGAAAATGLWFGWDKLGARMDVAVEGVKGREATFETARRIARDFPVFGTGPGTFEHVFPLYRESLDEYWPAQLHNDWLETRITFGWMGSALIAAAFLLAAGQWFTGRGLPADTPFLILLWLALGGCLVHALYDFPLQIYSVLMFFLLVCAVFASIGKRSRRDFAS